MLILSIAETSWIVIVILTYPILNDHPMQVFFDGWGQKTSTNDWNVVVFVIETLDVNYIIQSSPVNTAAYYLALYVFLHPKSSLLLGAIRPRDQPEACGSNEWTEEVGWEEDTEQNTSKREKKEAGVVVGIELKRQKERKKASLLQHIDYIPTIHHPKTC